MSQPPMRDHTSGTDRRPGRDLYEPAALVDLDAEAAQLREERIQHGDERTAKTLLKEGELRLTLISMKQGDVIRQHTAPGAIAVQVIEGALRLSAAEQQIEVEPGRVLVLARGVPHDVAALRDSTFLLTIAMPAS